jgi:hypothetical protein
MNKAILTLRDFSEGNKLNLDVFTNLYKGVTVDQFNQSYPEERFVRLNVEQMDKFIRDAFDVITKAEGEQQVALKEEAQEILKGFDQVLVEIDGVDVPHFVKAKEQKKPGEDIEKSHFDDLSYSPQLKIDKTGSEIKEALTKRLEKVEQERVKCLAEMTTQKAIAKIEPTEDLGGYWHNQFQDDLPKYKRFAWEKCTFRGISPLGANEKVMLDPYDHNPEAAVGPLTYAESAEQAEACKKYNDAVYQCFEYHKDKLNIDGLLRNLKDNKTYSITPKEAILIGF